MCYDWRNPTWFFGWRCSSTKRVLKEVKKILKKYNIHLILDEIYCGMGRSGKMFNFAYDNVDPDFVCTGKNTTSGTIPFSFVMSNKNFEKIIIDKIGRVNLGHTFFKDILLV